MPAKSPAQARLMQAVAHSPAFAKKVGISQKVGREFSSMAEGGFVPGTIPKVEKELKKALEETPKQASTPSVDDQGKFFTTPSAADKAKREAGLAAALKKRGYARGGSIDGCAQRGKTRAR